MGLERTIPVTSNGRDVLTKVLVEADHLLIGKPFSRRLDAAAIRAMLLEGDRLVFPDVDGALILTFGAEAARIAERLRQPKSRFDKLGVKSGSTVLLLGWDDAALRQEFALHGVKAQAAAEVSDHLAADVIFIEANSLGRLDILAQLRQAQPKAVVWVVSHKGKLLTLSDREVMAAADRQNYVSTKVVAYDETRTALRFVQRKG
jgi:hypothetical protein